MWIGIRPAMALISNVGDILKVLVIYRAALHYIFLRILRE